MKPGTRSSRSAWPRRLPSEGYEKGSIPKVNIPAVSGADDPADAGAKRILLPVADMMQYSKVPADLVSKFSLEIYSDPVDAAFKALGIK